MITIKTPGKLMLAGEWSILEPGNSCIVMALDQYVTVTIKSSTELSFCAPNLDLKDIPFVYSHPHLTINQTLSPQQTKSFSIAHYALEIGLRYLHEHQQSIKPFSLITKSPPSFTYDKVKLGFGSSAAVAVGIIKAVLAFHEHQTDKEIIFKLAYIAHYQAQGNMGSGFDIAAATYETTIVYQRFDTTWLAQQLADNSSLKTIVEQPWPLLTITPLPLSKDMIIGVGFVGYSASTPQLITAIMQFKHHNPRHYKRLSHAINDVVLALINAITDNNHEQIIDLLMENRLLLKQLSDESHSNLETKELRLLSDIAESFGAAGKFSGAGGGDCGIAVCFDKEVAQNINAAWQQQGLVPLAIKIHLK